MTADAEKPTNRPGPMWVAGWKYRDLLAEIERLRAALVAIKSEAYTFGDGCACSDVYVRTLDRVWEMAHNALTEEARRG